MGGYGDSTGFPLLRKFFGTFSVRLAFGGAGLGDFGGLADLEGNAVGLGCCH